MWDGERILDEVKSFFQSGFFYFLLGIAFLFVGYRLIGDGHTHSAFVFVIVILGIALVLYGTGTNASGEGTTGATKVAIAGGAGVLALVLGFGVVWDRQGLTEVFEQQRDYGVIDLSLAPDSSIPVDLSSFDVNASLSDRVPLPLWNDKQAIEIFVPIPPDKGETDVTVKFTPRPGFQANYLNENQAVAVNWSKDQIEDSTGFANEKIKVYKKTLDPIKPQELTLQTFARPESGVAAALVIRPQ